MSYPSFPGTADAPTSATERGEKLRKHVWDKNNDIILFLKPCHEIVWFFLFRIQCGGIFRKMTRVSSVSRIVFFARMFCSFLFFWDAQKIKAKEAKRKMKYKKMPMQTRCQRLQRSRKQCPETGTCNSSPNIVCVKGLNVQIDFVPLNKRSLMKTQSHTQAEKTTA